MTFTTTPEPSWRERSCGIFAWLLQLGPPNDDKSPHTIMARAQALGIALGDALAIADYFNPKKPDRALHKWPFDDGGRPMIALDDIRYGRASW